LFDSNHSEIRGGLLVESIQMFKTHGKQT